MVPTWNYAVVHAYGVLRAIEDGDWLKDQIERLTALQEGMRDEPWGRFRCARRLYRGDDEGDRRDRD